MTEIKKAKNVLGNGVMLVTHERAVRDDYGTTLETKLQMINQKLSGGIVNQSSTSNVQISPNCLNRWATPIRLLSVAFIAGESNDINEYMLEFTVGSSTFTLFLPVGTTWMNEEEPDWTTGYTYQVSILNGMAVGAGWPSSSSSSSE